MTTHAPALTAALLTPSGTGAMAVVRLSGAGAPEVLARFFEPNRATSLDAIAPDRLVYGRFVDPYQEREPIDDGIVAMRPDGDGGHIIDMTVHGGVRIVERMLILLQRCGARVRHRDESVRGAYALAKTRRAVRFIAAQHAVLPAELEAIARLCASDESSAEDRVRALIDRSRAAIHLVDGATVVFSGPPNAGKSTLINRLFHGAENLVSPRAGTTRDWTSVEVAVGGVPMRVIDTAGVRPSEDDVEREAIDRGLARFRSADVQIIVVDASEEVPAAFFAAIQPFVVRDRLLIALSKADLPPVWNASAVAGMGAPCVTTSGLTGLGVEELKTCLVRDFTVAGLEPARPALFSRRQADRFADLLSDRAGRPLEAAIRAESERIF